MNFSIINSLQKLRFFLAASFPILAKALWPAETARRVAERYPRGAAWVVKARKSLLGANVERAAGVFAVGEYANDVLDWRKVPAEAVGLLRVAVVLAALLCALLPVATVVDWPPVSVESILAIEGRGDVGGWSIALWLVALSLGWAALLIAVATSNRLLLLPTLALFLYINVASVAALPKAWWSLLLPGQGALAVVYSEWRHRSTNRWQRVGSLAATLVAAAGIGFVATIALPTQPWYRGQIPLAIAKVGVPLGLVLWSVGQVLHRVRPTPARVWVPAAAIAVMGLVLQVSLVVRGGWHIPAQGVATFGTQVTGYLWPLYYFIGVGVVFKVLRQTRTLQRASRDLIPLQVAIPITIALLFVATVALWAPTVVATPGVGWPSWFVDIAVALIDTFRVTWSTEVARQTADVMRWVVLALAVSSVWASRRGRLTAEAVARVQVLTLLGWFAIAEYYMELYGIARSSRVSATALFLFSVLILWMLHRTLMRFLNGDSAWWPRVARTCLYAAGLMFVILPIHARGAMHDPRLSGEIVYYLFQGVLVFGVPYYMFVYAARRFTVLPMTPQRALVVFLAGGFIAAALVAMDKVVIAGSFSEAWAEAGREMADRLEGRQKPPIVHLLPLWWIVLRGFAVVLALLAAMRFAGRRTRVVMLRPSAAVFGVVALSAGLACFSNRVLELPLMPNQVELLVTPVRASLWFDASFLALQLSYLLPGLLLALVATREASMSRAIRAAALAVLLHVALQLAWPGQEVWLRSTEVVSLAAAGGICAFLLMAGAVRERLDDLLVRKWDAEPTKGTPTDNLLDRRELRIVALAVILVSATVVGLRTWTSRLVPRPEAAGLAGVPVPAAWRADAGTFVRGHVTGDTAHLAFAIHNDTGTAQAVLLQLAPELAQRFPEFTLQTMTRWDHLAPGATAFDFTWLRHPADSSTFTLGTLAIAPIHDGRRVIATVTYGPLIQARRWDVARIIQSMQSAQR